MSELFAQTIDNLPADMQTALLKELNRIARRYMQTEHAGHTLQATALVNEAYVNLAGKSIQVSDNSHFIALVAHKMRQILVDHARAKVSEKRGSRPIMVTLSGIASMDNNDNIDLIYLDELLTKLAEFDSRAAHIFELKMFSSITNDEVASLLEISLATVERDLKAAKAWLKIQMPSPNVTGNNARTRNTGIEDEH
jgi:RNA polymerase sigma factor (TIGR02999 family)